MNSVQTSKADDLGYFLKPLQSFFDDQDLTEVAVNRPGEIWTEGSAGWVKHDAPELTYAQLERIAKLVANNNSKSIKSETPILSGALPWGQRIQVVIPPACEPGTVSLTIRKPSLLDMSLQELEDGGAFQEIEEVTAGLQAFERSLLQLMREKRILEFLDLAVKHKRNILIVGKTGSGKTTIAKSLIRSVPPNERLITIEDVPELGLQHHANKVHLFYSRGDEGGFKITAKQALAACLRMKPDRILLSEMRGDESWEFIKSINTGHPGAISTMHANGALEAFEQLTALIKDSPTGAHLPADFIKNRLHATIDIVLYYSARRLREIYYNPERKHGLMA